MSSFRTVKLSDPAYESNGIRFITLKTPHLKGRGDICLFVPTIENNADDLPIFILLHGVYGSAWSWALNGGAAQTAQRLIETKQISPAIIAMPSDGLWGDGSGYFAHHEKQFDSWITHDVPLAIRELIPEAQNNKTLCIGGLSMGGYGALMLGARFPTLFRAISAHSSITRLEEMRPFVEEPMEGYFKENTCPDVIEAMIKNKELIPPLRFDCGIDDDLIQANRLLHKQLEHSEILHTYEEFDGGHEWPFWQTHVEKTFLFFDKYSQLSS